MDDILLVPGFISLVILITSWLVYLEETASLMDSGLDPNPPVKVNETHCSILESFIFS